MTEYEKDCEALDRVFDGLRKGRIQADYYRGEWEQATTVGLNFKYRIKPEPKKVPLELKDWAGGPWWVRSDDTMIWRQIIGVDDSKQYHLRITTGTGEQQKHAQTMMDWQRTRDFVNIEPCYKTE